MLDFSFVMTIFFLLVGPVKIIPAFARLARGSQPGFKRSVAVQGALFAAIICALVVGLTQSFVAKYQLSIASLQITMGLVLLISALGSIFPRREAPAPAAKQPGSTQLALAPLASPVIVAPAGVAAIMVAVLLGAGDPAAFRIIATALAIVMAMNLLVMLFNDLIVKIPGLMLVLQLLGTVLIVVQVALAVQELIYAFTRLGVFVHA